jgi:hypothetical protein
VNKFRKKRAPNKSFMHTDDCRVLAADPTVSIPWNEVEPRHWQATCQCGVQHSYEPVGDRVRLDPLDAKTSRHAGECGVRLRARCPGAPGHLKVKDGAGEEYGWVSCGACDTAWQVPYYAESVG